MFSSGRICCGAAICSFFLEAGGALAETPQDPYLAMQKVFDICVENMRSGTLMSNEQLASAAMADLSGDLDTSTEDFKIRFETNDDMDCAVWVEAEQFNARDFRDAIDAYIPSLSEGSLELNCVWLPVFPTNTCRLPGQKISYSDGWERSFSISFRIVAYEYVAMLIEQTIAFDPDGFAHLPAN